MEHERNRVTIWGFIKGLFKAVIGFSLLVQSLLFIIVLVVLLGVFGSISQSLNGQSGDGPSIAVPDGGALILNPTGTLVEISPPEDLFEDAVATAFGGSPSSQVSVHELVEVIRAAKKDSRIKVLVLDFQGLYVPSIYAEKAHYLGAAIEDFRKSDKRVIAIGDSYSQEQYLIASEADTVLMHDFGAVMVTGYGSYRQFYKAGMDMLGVTGHVFRVGTFKSAIEPYIRDDMSPAAKEANMAFLGVLWDNYADAIDQNRGLQSGGLKAVIDNYAQHTAAAGGDAAKMAVETGLVDRLVDREAQVEFIAGLVGRPEGETSGFKGIGYEKYKILVPAKEDREDVGNVAVITAAGEILDGDQPVGVVGGDTLARAIRDARLDENVKAVVLRVDSPGGSVFASEVIRDELLKVKEAKKPLVVSMGSLAASGGYWISVNADEIWAAPTTVTGSIGVFGFIPTFENALAKIGVNTDGVGTTELAAINGAGPGPLPEAYGDLIQAAVEDIYRRFLEVVAEGRGMTTVQVDAMAQGRVWIGDTALDLGLVDNLGTIDEAIEAAATKAGLDEYDVVGMAQQKTPLSMFLENLYNTEAQGVVERDIVEQLFGGTDHKTLNIDRLIDYAKREAAFFASFNDPRATYIRCLECVVQ